MFGAFGYWLWLSRNAFNENLSSYINPYLLNVANKFISHGLKAMLASLQYETIDKLENRLLEMLSNSLQNSYYR